MKDVLVLGAGKIGAMIADLLVETGDYKVTVGDSDTAQLDRLHTRLPIDKAEIDVADRGALDRALAGSYAVLSAVPYYLTVGIAEAARDAGVHYLDLTEDVASTRRIRELAEGAGTALIPQCGLAPGFI